MVNQPGRDLHILRPFAQLSHVENANLPGNQLLTAILDCFGGEEIYDEISLIRFEFARDPLFCELDVTLPGFDGLRLERGGIDLHSIESHYQRHQENGCHP